MENHKDDELVVMGGGTPVCVLGGDGGLPDSGVRTGHLNSLSLR